MSMTINLDGAVIDAMGKPGGVINRYCEELATKAYAHTQANVPVDTGELKASGAIEPDGNAWAVVYHAQHALFVEYGTHHPPRRTRSGNLTRAYNIPANPFMRRALLAVVPR